jgi:large subunit ribosomal protein L41
MAFARQTLACPRLLQPGLIYGRPGGRDIHSSTALNGKRNFRKFTIPNLVGQYDPLHTPKHLQEKELSYPMGRDLLKTKHPGIWFKRKFVPVKEMEPQLMVPDLTGFALKPYVSYRSADVQQSEFTAKALFNRTYADEIFKKAAKGEEVQLQADPEEAKIKAKQTGADLFMEDCYMSSIRKK